MSIDFARIRELNIRAYGEETAHLDLLQDLYSDRTHFVYELIQNAEDAGATWIEFALSRDRLEVRHDGRLFDEADVIGITAIGKGTKRADSTKIGKFGIGFKSVYAYTTRPQVHCGDYRFEIKKYIRPYALETGRSESRGTTLFVFPFDRAEPGPNQALEEISGGLRNLPPEAFLFLSNITELHARAGRSTLRRFRRTRRSDSLGDWVELESDGSGPASKSEWLILSRAVDHEAEGKFRVETALKVERDHDRPSIAPAPPSPLVVYFPTAIDTRLRFLIQGPYRTTPNRENIKHSDPWNEYLIQETAELLTESLPALRQAGLMSVGLLRTLPTVTDDFPKSSPFYPLYEGVAQALRDQDLLPADGGGFTEGRNARLGRGAELRKLLPPKLLQALLGEEAPLNWVTGEVTENANPALWSYLRDELDIEVLTPDDFGFRFHAEFVEQQSDDWMIQLYGFLESRAALWRGVMKHDPYIRLEDGTHVPPFDASGAPNAYLPVDELSSFPTVKRSIANRREARGFLTTIGLKPPDLVAEILEVVVPKYDEATGAVEERENVRDVQRIVRALHEASAADREVLIARLGETPFLRAHPADSPRTLEYHKPQDLYVETSDLRLFFAKNPDIWFVSDRYDRWLRPLMVLGIDDRPFVDRNPVRHGHVVVRSEWGHHVRGLDGFDPEFDIDGLSFALEQCTPEKARYIWNQLLAPNSAHIRGTVESSTHKSFANASRTEKFSPMGKLVAESAWLPKKGERGLFQAVQLALSDLPNSFHRDEALADALRMRPTGLAEVAKQLGLRLADLRLLQEHAELVPDLIRELRRRLQPSEPVDQSAGLAAPQTRGLPKISEEPKEPAEGRPSSLNLPSEHSASSEGGRMERSSAEGWDGSGVKQSPPDTSWWEGGPQPDERSGVRQDRFATYVDWEGGGAGPDGLPEHRDALSQAGVDAVVKFEEGEGRAARVMPANHPGYDVESVDPTGESRYIEVKAVAGQWGPRGVGLSKRQFEAGLEIGSAFWLYVVEFAGQAQEAVFPIVDPSRRAQTFFFDSGWRGAKHDE